MSGYDVLIVGAGFAGIYAAWRQARDGRKVALVEAADFIGGNLNSRPWNGFWLDNGTHNFDIRTPLGEEFFLDILRDKALIFEDQKWATTSGSTWTYGFEFPEFGVDHPQKARKIMQEMVDIAAAPSKDDPDDYATWYRKSYGATMADSILPMVQKYTGSPVDDISVDARGLLGMFTRTRLGSDAEMIALKEADQFWDDRLSVTLACNDARFLGKNVNKRFAFPAEKGLKGFCEAAEDRLRELGVDLFKSAPVTKIADTGTGVVVQAGDHSIEAPALFWSLPEIGLSKILGIDIDLAKSAIPVGTSFFVFEVAEDSVLGPDYLHDYTLERVPFRYNKAGIYGNQTKADGKTFVTCEVPAHPGALKSVATQETSDKAWQALLDVGYLKPGTSYSDRTFWGHPVAYTLPKVGWRVDYERMQDEIRARSERIVGIEFGYRGRLSFMNFYQDKLQERLR